MKKTIAAILVTILASAGYVVLDKTSADKIDLMASQISSQQAVINNYIAPENPVEMQTGSTLRCYPAAGTVVQAYVRDPSRTTTWATTTTTTIKKAGDEPIFDIASPESTAPITTKPHTTFPADAIWPAAVQAQWDDSTEPTTPGPTYATIPYNYDLEYYYHLRADVRITKFRCEMVGRSLTEIPQYKIELSGTVDPVYAGRPINVWFGDSSGVSYYSGETIHPDGSFSVFADAVLANSAVIPLREIRID